MIIIKGPTNVQMAGLDGSASIQQLQQVFTIQLFLI